jgi:leader peptidase (prepilin peptidase)/N-methyltransferase
VGEIAGEIAAALAVVLWLIALSAFDIRQRRLPNLLTLPGAVAILLAAGVTGHGLGALFGAVALFGVYASVHLIAPAAMGAGDVKLAIGVGALTGAFGPDVWVLAAVGASVCTAVLAVCRSGRAAESSVPHGPSMCLASVAAVGLAVLA